MFNENEIKKCIKNEYEDIFEIEKESFTNFPVITFLKEEINVNEEPIEDDEYVDDKKIILNSLECSSENSKELIENVEHERKLFEITDYKVSCNEKLEDFQVKSEDDETNDIRSMNCNWIDVKQIIEDEAVLCDSIEETANDKIISDSKKKHKCMKCEYQTKFQSRINLHLLTHAEVRPYACDICNKRFKISYHLKSHALTHLVEARFYCMHCNYKSTNKAYLAAHLKNKHSKVKKYKCSMCEYQANHKSNLRTHIITHDNVKPFVCTVCNKQFKLNHQLERHRFIHSTEKKFHCVQCEYKSNQKRDFDMHFKNKHGKRNDKDYKCLMCPYQTNLRYRLAKHSKRHLPDEDNEIKNADKAVV